MVRPTLIEAPSLEALKKHPSVRESPLYTQVQSGRVRCGVCERHCTLPSGCFGFCGTRLNMDGALYTVVYGDISSISANPIEKKPFFHFWPGSYALTVGTWGCNFTCPWCQNFSISKSPPNLFKASFVSPENFIRMITAEGCQGASFSFNEPTMLFEYALDTIPIAHRKGLYNNYVSNGYMTQEALKMLKEAGLDAIKFDLKGDREAVRRFCAADVELVWRNVRYAKDLGLHVEVVTLIIPGVNDDEACIEDVASRHLKEAGQDTPLHFTRFYPAYKMADRRSTPVETLEKARGEARMLGIRYVYLGNVPGHRFENTYCHNCNELLIERYGFSLLQYKMTKDRRCSKCGCNIPLVGEYVPQGSGVRFW